MASFEQGGIFIVPHLLCQGILVFTVCFALYDNNKQGKPGTVFFNPDLKMFNINQDDFQSMYVYVFENMLQVFKLCTQ